MNNPLMKIFSGILALLTTAHILPAANIPNSRYAGKLDPRPVKLPKRYAGRPGEMRGVWIATVSNLDYPRPSNSTEYKKMIRNMFRRLKEHNFNAVFFQVRPTNDAFYPSKLNPWSRYLSGSEGRPLPGEKNFDPLRFMIDEAHRNGLQFHAWLNPYRVIGATKMSKYQYLKTLAPNNFARRHPQLVMENKISGNQRQLVLNPGEVQVRNFVAATVMEIVRNYPVDSIHFDDYFYPDNAPGSADLAAFRRYNPRRLPLDQWRRNNVNELIKSVHSQIKTFNRQYRRNVQFGVSPFGIWRNRKNTPHGSLTAGKESYSEQFADTRSWVKNRWIDYIVPQLYWNFNHDSAAYAALTDWWCSTVRGTGVKLYIGHAAYQLGKANWSVNELYYQLLYNRSKVEVSGSIIFSYRSLAQPENQAMQSGARNMLKKFWKQ
ncbi:MAG: hypothetical protein E7052_07440 [Lentisphaerae bacterium]|nr:hypothetical protein [Lentisphaerota bacterium]